MFCIEATAVEAIGRITPGCLGLWNDATEAALKPVKISYCRGKWLMGFVGCYGAREAEAEWARDGGR